METTKTNTMYYYVCNEQKTNFYRFCWPASKNPTSNEIFSTIQREIKNEKFDWIVFRNNFIAVRLLPKIRPLSIFKELCVSVSEPNDAVAMQIPSIMLVSNSSIWISAISFSFVHLKNIYDPISFHYNSFSVNNDGNIRDMIENSVAECILKYEMDRVSSKFNAKDVSIMYHCVSNPKDRLLFASGKPIDLVNLFFSSDYSLFSSKWSLLYDFFFPSLINNTLSLSCRFNTLFSDLLSSLTYFRMSSFSKYFLSTLNRILPNTSMKDTIEDDFISIVSKIFIQALLPFQSIFTPLDLSFKDWSSFVSAFAQGSKEPLSCHQKKKLQSFKMTDKIISSFICSDNRFPQRLLCHNYSLFYSLRTQSHPYTSNSFGKVLYSSVIEIDNSRYTIILTFGFVMILNFSPQNTSYHEIFPTNYNYVCHNISPCIFSMPIQHCCFIPISSNLRCGAIICTSGSMIINFQSDEAIFDFFSIFEILRNQISSFCIEPTTPKYGTTKIEFRFPLACQNSSITTTVNAIGNLWTKQFELMSLIQKLERVSNDNSLLFYPSIQSACIPKHITTNLKSDIFGDRICTTQLFSENQESIGDPILFLRDYAFDLSFDYIHSPSIQIVFSSLLIFGISDFMKSIELNSVQLLELQLSSFHSQLDSFTINGSKLIHFLCAYMNRIELLSILLKQYDISNENEKIGTNPLLFSSRNTNIGVSQLVFRSGADPDHGNSSGLSPTISSLVEKNSSLMSLLLQNGSSTNKTLCTNHISLLLFSLESNNSELFFSILPYLDSSINNPTNNGSFVSHICIDLKKSKELAAIYQNCPFFDVNCFSSKCPHPLHYLITLANQEQCMNMLNILLGFHNIKINQMDSKGLTPLMKAIVLNQNQIALRLMEDERCNILLSDLTGCTALHYAMEKKNLEIINVLIALKAIVNTPNNVMETPFSLSLSKPNSEIASLFLKNGRTPFVFIQNPKQILLENNSQEADKKCSFYYKRFTTNK